VELDPASWGFAHAVAAKMSGGIVAYSGVNASDPIDAVTRSAAPTAPTHTPPQVTTTDARRLVLTITGVNTATNFPTPVGTSEQIDQKTGLGAPSYGVQMVHASQTVAGLSTALITDPDLDAAAAMMTIGLRPLSSATTVTTRYSYSGGGDGTAITLTTSNVVIDSTIPLPGGVVVTRQATGRVWAYPNIHGDTTYTLNEAGAISGPFLYDPYGNSLASTAANTSPGDFDNGWLGQHQRPTEHQPGLRTTIEMGARPYRAELGRFLRTDPVFTGAGPSAYGYVSDPINAADLSGCKRQDHTQFDKCHSRVIDQWTRCKDGCKRTRDPLRRAQCRSRCDITMDEGLRDCRAKYNPNRLPQGVDRTVVTVAVMAIANAVGNVGGMATMGGGGGGLRPTRR
jgi:RHS repeat-associated protein